MSKVPERPDERHLWKTVHLHSEGLNYTGTNWTTEDAEDPPFNTPINYPLYWFMDAPKRKSFRIFSIHGYFSTIPIVVDYTTRPARCNLNIAVHSIKVGRSYAHAHGWNLIFHSRIYNNQCSRGALAYDADGAGDYDFATDHIAALAGTQFRAYDPEPHYLYPHGIDVGPHLMFELSWGGESNMKYINGAIRVRWVVEYSIVPSKKFRKVFDR